MDRLDKTDTVHSNQNSIPSNNEVNQDNGSCALGHH